MKSETISPLPPQAPELTLGKRLLGPFHVTGVVWYRLQYFAVARFPEWAITVSTALFTAMFFLILRRIRAAIAANLEVVLGPCGFLERQRRIWRVMWSFAWCSSERYERLVGKEGRTVELVGRETWRERTTEEIGFVLVTAHLGHWEVGALLPSDREDLRVHVIREEEADPRAQEMIRQLVEEMGREQLRVHFASADPGLGARLLAALRRGEIVALQGDRPAAGGRSATVTIFDRPLEVPVGPVALARAAEAKIQPVFVFRQGRLSSRVVVRDPIVVAKTDDVDRDLAEALQAIAREVEWAIREEPFQWFCFRRLWPDAA